MVLVFIYFRSAYVILTYFNGILNNFTLTCNLINIIIIFNPMGNFELHLSDKIPLIV